MEDSRFIVGIDLGTTNIAVTYFDMQSPKISLQSFEIGQLIAPGEFAARKLLPACALVGIADFLSDTAIDLPWSKNDFVVGKMALDLGADYPLQFISSAKSWLCHWGVNRREEILPWGVNSAVKVSPLVITERYLAHLVAAWDYKFCDLRDKNGNACSLVDQQVVITIPASFDEVARELTLEAANKAGFKHIQLLEEPLAAFYAWVNAKKRRKVSKEDKILVIDIGGGTSDFSIIETNADGILTRSISGEHLLLGGDNLDQALAVIVEKKCNRKLNSSEWSSLVCKAREAKEQLLSDTNIESVDISMICSGSSVIANTISATVFRNELEDLINNGFLPEVEPSSNGVAKKHGLKSFGLPYASDPAITRQLMSFLRYAAKMSNLDGIFQPTHILFNGGVLTSNLLRKKIMHVVNSWCDQKVLELENDDFLSTVSSGASYFGLSRRGCGIQVKSGTSRSYYIKTSSASKECYVCIMPRAVDENSEMKSTLPFTLTSNQKVSFPLYCSSTRINDKLDDLIENDEDLTLLTDLHTVLTYGKQLENKLKGTISSKLNQSGVLEICINAAHTNHSWPLTFDVRFASEQPKISEVKAVDINLLLNAELAIADAFKIGGDKLNQIYKILENSLQLPKKDWPLSVLRRLADFMLEMNYSSLNSKIHEAKWLNLTGFFLRPGFGDPADDLRIKKAWRIWLQGINNANDQMVQAEWWIFWRRIAGGLRLGQQENLLAFLQKMLCPKFIYRERIKEGSQAKAEMWRTLGSLEHIPHSLKLKLSQMLVNRQIPLNDYELWALARLGARHLVYGNNNTIIPNIEIENVIKKMLSLEVTDFNTLAFSLIQLARKTNERSFDISDPIIAEISEKILKNLPSYNCKPLYEIIHENLLEQSKILGDSLPLGLSL